MQNLSDSSVFWKMNFVFSKEGKNYDDAWYSSKQSWKECEINISGIISSNIADKKDSDAHSYHILIVGVANKSVKILLNIST